MQARSLAELLKMIERLDTHSAVRATAGAADEEEVASISVDLRPNRIRRHRCGCCVDPLIGHVNVIQIRLSVMNRIERDEVDDIVTAFMLVAVAFVVDNVRTAHWEEREAKRQTEQQKAERAEQLRVVHVTMHTVQDIVNNCLNQIQLLRLDAESHVPEESLRLFDEAIQTQLQNLRNSAIWRYSRRSRWQLAAAWNVSHPSRRV
jgi:hypothetical protein